jgi:Na+/H+-dicarboxylate symporter
MKIVLKLLAGMAAGIIIGLAAPAWGIRLAMTIRLLLGELILFVIPLIIFFFVTSGIASLPRRSGQLLGRTLAFAYGSTITAGILAYLVAVNLLPRITPAARSAGTSEASLQPLLAFDVEPLFGVITALVAAFIFGLGINATGSTTLRACFDEGRAIIDRLLARVIIPLLPVYIAGVFAGMAADGRVFATLQTFGLVLLVAVALHWVWLGTLFGVTGALQGRSPWRLIRLMLPAYVTALGTMSSAATIPVTLRSVKSLGVRGPIADFVTPLCANIHLSGSTITLVACATAVMAISPELGLPTLAQMVPFILVLGVVMVAAPGAPGGAVMAALGLLGSMLGFSEANLALMIALYVAQDSFGTATNVTGDGAIALWMDRFFGDVVDHPEPVPEPS